VLICCPIFLSYFFTSYYIYPYILISILSNFTSAAWNLQPASWEITIHRRTKSPRWVRCCMWIQKGSQPSLQIKYWIFQPSLWVLSWRSQMSVQWVWWSRIMTIPIARSGMVKVETLESSPCLSISKKMFRTSSKRCYITTKWAEICLYKLQAIHSERNSALPIPLLCTLHIWICEILPRPLHHNCVNSRSHPWIYCPTQTLYTPMYSCCPTRKVHRMFHNQLPLEMTTFPNTAKVHFR
jgi:hypothetical protein